MPVLHRYKSKQEYYILTRLNGAVITFQVTREGRSKLSAIGVVEGQQFGRSLLLELCKSGDAYTRTSLPDIDLSGWVQTALDFTDDPVPESSVPVCSVCGSPYGLHLISIGEKDTARQLSIRCEQCCASQRQQIGLCVPAAALTRPFMKQVMELSGVKKLDQSARAYRDLLEHSYLDRLSRSRQTSKQVQEPLFGTAHNGQERLL